MTQTDIAEAANGAANALHGKRAMSLETLGMTKIFGAAHRARRCIDPKVDAGSFHALLGENGAGKSTLVKSHHGLLPGRQGRLCCSTGKEASASAIRAIRATLGLGMVYQHFTLVPCLTGAENLVISRGDAPSIIDWTNRKKGARRISGPHAVPRAARCAGVASLAAGEKQKLEILKLLYLDQRLLILDEPTSVLTPQEADEILGLLKGMTAPQGDSPSS